jgi:hypothetical protein
MLKLYNHALMSLEITIRSVNRKKMVGGLTSGLVVVSKFSRGRGLNPLSPLLVTSLISNF